MNKNLLFILILSIISSVSLIADTDTELDKYAKTYRAKPTDNLTGVYVELLPESGFNSIHQRENNKYVINFMWINKNYSEEQKYILPNTHNGFEAVQYLNNIIHWASAANGDTLIQIWYDSETTSEKTITQTKEYLFSKIEEYLLLIGASDNAIAPIIFRDLRSLPIVKENPGILNPKFAIFLRADLMKTILIYNDIVLEGASYSVFADMDVKPMCNEDLYDTKTMENLQEYGFVMGDDGQRKNGGMENQFQILSYHNKDLLEAWAYAMITLNIARMLNGLGIYQYYHDHNNFPEDYIIKNMFTSMYAANRVFDSYERMFHYFQHLSGKDTLMVWQEDSKLPYNREKYGLEIFDLKLNGILYAPLILDSWSNPQTELGKKIQEQRKKGEYKRIDIPVKDIDTIVGQSHGWKSEL